MTKPSFHDDVPRWSEEVRRGLFRRRVRIGAEAGRAWAAVEDDVHRFTIELEHDQNVVTALQSHGERYPWDVCAEAAGNLSRAVGAPIEADVTMLSRWTKASDNCTHRFDLVALAIAQAARGVGHRQYDISVALGDRGPRQAWLERDQAPRLNWTLEGMTIRSSDACDGQDLRRVLAWARDALSPDEAEAIFTIRRAILVSNSRLHPAEGHFDPGAAMRIMAGACYVFQDGVVERATMTRDNYRDFDAHADRLLGERPSSPS